MQFTTGIYKITNTINAKVYIGQSVCIERRWKEHKERAFRPTHAQYNIPLYRAMRKYGLHVFTFEILEKCFPEELNTQEQYWICKLQSSNPQYGYNLTAGGHASSPLVLTQDDAKMIQNLLQTTSLSQENIAQQFNVTQRTVSYINRGKLWCDPNLQYPLRERSTSPTFCPNCGNPMHKNSKLCHICAQQYRVQWFQERSAVPWPSREELKAKIRVHTMTTVAKQYQVSPTTIRRWCKKLNLPHSKHYIDTINETQWQTL